MKRLTGDYANENKADLYAEIQARRDERDGEGFDGITSKSSHGEMVKGLTKDDKSEDKDPEADAPKKGENPPFQKSKEKAGVGKEREPRNKHLPDSVLIKRRPTEDTSTKITDSASVTGDQGKMIIDILNSRPVHVSLIDGQALTPDIDGRLVFIESNVASDLKSVAAARALFAVKADGTVIYNPRGFDDVPPTADFNMVDIVALIEHNHSQ